MAEPNTFLKLHRSILDSAVFSDAEVLRLWIYFLCKASTTDRETIVGGKVITIKRGQLVFGRKKASNIIGISESKVYRVLKLLEELQCISIEANNKFSVISVVNWDKFQGKEEKTNSKRTANEQQTNTVKELYNYNNIIDKIDKIDIIDKIDKSGLPLPTPNALTAELVESGYISEDDICIGKYNDIIEDIIDRYSFEIARSCLWYFIKRYRRQPTDENGNEIENKLAYFKTAINNSAERIERDNNTGDFDADEGNEYFTAALTRSYRYLQETNKEANA